MSRKSTRARNSPEPASWNQIDGRATSAGILVIAVLTLAAYSPTFGAKFVWDDDQHFVANTSMMKPWGFVDFWTSRRAQYYPLTSTTFWIMRRLWDLNPLPYHLLNIILQSVNGILLWRLLRRLELSGAWLAGALFAVHPVNVQSVAWATELKNTQSGLFYLLALISFLAFDRTRQTRCYVFSLILFCLAILSKSSTVMLPVVLLLIHGWRRKGWNLKSVVAYGPFFLLSMLAGLATVFMHQKHVDESHWNENSLERLIIAGRCLWFYLGKLLLPVNLSFVYRRWNVSAADLLGYVYPMSFLVLLAGLWLLRNRGARGALFGAGYFVISLFPVLGAMRMYYTRYSYVADHWQYLAAMGPIAFFAAGLDRLLAPRPPFRGSLGVGTKWLIPVSLLSLCVMLTWKQSAVYRDEQQLWQDVLRKDPGSWMAYTNLADLARLSGDLETAAVQYSRALDLMPNLTETRISLGLTLEELGRPDEALLQYGKVVEFDPENAAGHYNYACLLLAKGETAQAIHQYEGAIRTNPEYEPAYNDLGMTLAKQGQTERALGLFQRAVQLDPHDAKAQFNLGLTLERLGRLPEATQCYRESLRLDPGFELARRKLRAMGVMVP